MNNERKLEDILSEMYVIYCKDRVPKIKLKHLISGIESYLSCKEISKNDNYYYDIVHIYNELTKIPTNAKSGTIYKISFNHLYQNVKDKYNNKIKTSI